MLISKTREDDYFAWVDERQRIQHASMHGKISDAEALRRAQKLNDKYKGRVHAEDFHYFTEELPFMRMLLQFRMPPHELATIVLHERAHFEAAEQHGLSPRYGVAVYIKNNPHPIMPYWFNPFITCKGSTFEIERDVALAPENPSTEDRNIVKRKLKSS